MKNKNTLSYSDLNRIIEMAWEDRTTFDAIKSQYGLNEQSVKELMRANLKSSSYKIWRKRVWQKNKTFIKKKFHYRQT